MNPENESPDPGPDEEEEEKTSDTVRLLKLEEELWTKEDEGFNPYNTGQFDTND